MSTILRGFTFGTNATAHNVDLHALVDNAVVTSIPMSEFAAAAHVVQVDTGPPGADQGEGALWWDSVLGMLRSKQGVASTRNDALGVGPGMLNASGSTIITGALVVASANNEISPCMTAAWPEVLGSTVSAVANSARTIVRKTGIGTVAVAGPVTIGDTLIAAGQYTSWSSGRARSSKAFGSTLVTLGVEIGISLSQIGSTTGLATYLAWR